MDHGVTVMKFLQRSSANAWGAQATLSRYIGRLRDMTATHTDERVRLEGEAISGSLAMKMLGWEQWLLDRISKFPKSSYQQF